ncbi:hypothetical protein MNO14_15395 [Luteimonas sp. S4-F44]|uniref:hypothetical protein n=1 Tax=Luteimonas sp. S4-F44 TaxID=2925842 RepID=UPI001F53C7C4|nr:hypothetical protein [Luteimonas sp. S4-F44]UNK42299.1 hypothetical protein MNO14_15395 [Luteimonas sp. S4-F44]
MSGSVQRRRRALACCPLLFAVVGLVTACSDGAQATQATGRADAGEQDQQAFLEAYNAGVQSVAGATSSASADDGEGAAFSAQWPALSSVRIDDLSQFVNSGDADAWLQARYRALGYPGTDIVDANALLFLVHWEAFHGVRATPSQAAGLREQMAAHWARQGAQARDTQALANRQRVYELVAAALGRQVDRMRGQARAQAAFSQAIRQDFQRQTGNDLATIELTGAGFQSSQDAASQGGS